ncbi:pantoate--beta-alanine ligase [Candidatus Neomarinimicrobiota bacterium]
MIILKTVSELRIWRDSLADNLGLVPTMGSLHAGHLALVERAAVECENVLVTIFVNPTQFNNPADFDSYPRDKEQDIKLLSELGVNAIFIPDEAEIYPAGECTTVSVSGLGSLWEGAHRPGHFEGVATVVAKLFNLTNADRAYFGEKDYQQLQIVRRMVIDLLLPVEIVACPIVRAHDGLALSSRNALLDDRSREMAKDLIHSLERVQHDIKAGRAADTAIAEQQTKLNDGGWEVDYLALVDDSTLCPISAMRPGARLIIAASIGGVRLIDNIWAE